MCRHSPGTFYLFRRWRLRLRAYALSRYWQPNWDALLDSVCPFPREIHYSKTDAILLRTDLAAHCRLLLHDHPRYPRLVRRVFLYPLYVLSEVAIISTDLAELLGSAIGLVLLFPKLPLSVAVMLTALDVIFILALGDSKQRGRPLRMLEFIIIILVWEAFYLIKPPALTI